MRSPDEYMYENENARLLMKDIIGKVVLSPNEEITEKFALDLYNHIHNTPEKVFYADDRVFVPRYDIEAV